MELVNIGSCQVISNKNIPEENTPKIKYFELASIDFLFDVVIT